MNGNMLGDADDEGDFFTDCFENCGFCMCWRDKNYAGVDAHIFFDDGDCFVD